MLLGALLLATAALATAGSVAARPDATTRAQQQQPTIKAASTPIFTANALYLGVDKGFFQQAGVNVVPSILNSGTVIVTAIVSGAIDVGICGHITAYQAYESGLPIRLLAPDVGIQRGSAGEAVAATSSIWTPKDLEGKTFAVSSLRSSAELSARVWIANAGGDPSKVTFVQLPTASQISAIETGRVDAADLNDPFYHQALHDSKIRILGAAQSSVQPYGVTTGAWCANSNWVAQNPDAARAFVKGVIKANTYTNTHPKEGRAEYAKFAGVSAADAAATAIGVYPTAFDTKWMQKQADYAYKYGLLDKPMNATDILASVAPVKGKK
jgi:NitT/TauT family transport system substrate-binding protein